MLIDIRHLNVPVSDALSDFTRRRIARALQPFEEAVSRVDVRTKDVNGPRGGVDVESSVTVRMPSIEQPVVITGKGEDAYAAIADVCASLHESISRTLGKRRDTARSGRSRSRAAPRRATPASESTPREAPEEVPEQAPEQTPDEAAADTSGQRGDSVVVTTLDEKRLRNLIRASRDTRDRDAAEALGDELDRAEVVPPERIAGNVVTMNSRVVFKDEGTGESREVSLVYPEDSDPEHGRVSVFAPVGAALLGLTVGQTIDWPLPQGRLKRYRVVDVLYQPEAAGQRD